MPNLNRSQSHRHPCLFLSLVSLLSLSLSLSPLCPCTLASSTKVHLFGRATVLCSVGLALWVAVASPLAARVHLLCGYGRPGLTDGRPSPLLRYPRWRNTVTGFSSAVDLATASQPAIQAGTPPVEQEGNEVQLRSHDY